MVVGRGGPTIFGRSTVPTLLLRSSPLTTLEHHYLASKSLVVSYNPAPDGTVSDSPCLALLFPISIALHIAVRLLSRASPEMGAESNQEPKCSWLGTNGTKGASLCGVSQPHGLSWSHVAWRSEGTGRRGRNGERDHGQEDLHVQGPRHKCAVHLGGGRWFCGPHHHPAQLQRGQENRSPAGGTDCSDTTDQAE